MAHISLRVTEEEKSFMERYAKLHGKSLSDTVKEAVFEKMEDEYDLASITEFLADPEQKTYAHEDVKKLLGLR